MPLPTVEEYLQLSDWKFEVAIKEGRYNTFFWLRSHELAMTDLLATIDLPRAPFSVLVTNWDWHGGAAAIYGKQPGWRSLGEWAISDVATDLPQLQYGADNAQMLLDVSITDQELLQNLSNFAEPQTLDALEEKQADRFWKAIEAINPYCYFSYGLCDGLTFIARGADLYRQLLGRVSLDEIEMVYKNSATAARSKTWAALGPECGPEICIEDNCNRLRIKLAVRCFIHQLQWSNACLP